MYMARVGVINHNIEKIVLRIILWSTLALAILYAVFLCNMVKNIVERKSLEARERVLSSEVGDLELTYLSLSNKIDLPLSKTLGFKETKPAFATRKSLGLLNHTSPLSNVKTVQNDI